jgi:hypothetical protein
MAEKIGNPQNTGITDIIIPIWEVWVLIKGSLEWKDIRTLGG